jgi:hypothetical protein
LSIGIVETAVRVTGWDGATIAFLLDRVTPIQLMDTVLEVRADFATGSFETGAVTYAANVWTPALAA